MKRIYQGLFSILLVFSLLAQPVMANESKPELVDKGSSAILMERDTGKVLYDKNSTEELPPASMTKIMTMILIMEALEKGEISLDEKVRASANAASMGGSQIFLEEGEEMTVNELLKGIAIASGNDASVAMAERLGGSVEEFVKMMNNKAKELGLKNTQFKNATGLPAEGHYSTARDMALMAKALLKHEQILQYTSKYEDYLREDSDNKFWLVNTNRLIKFYPGVDGLKTGYTSEAKYCLTATAKKGNMRVIAVVMGAPSPKERNQQITKMLDYAFNRFETHPVYKRGEEIDQVEISKGSTKKVAAITSEDISILTKKGENLGGIEEDIQLRANLKAPIKKGDPVGMLLLKKGNEVLAKNELIAAEDVDEATLWELFKRTVGSFAGR